MACVRPRWDWTRGAWVRRRCSGPKGGQSPRAAGVGVEEVRVGPEALLGAEGGAFPAIDQVIDAGAAALCAEAVGVMETLNAQTLEYLKTRQQFGHPIGRFQVLQHRAGDMFIHCELSRPIAL